MTNLTEMLSKFVNSKTASSSSSGSLPSITVTNPKEDLKGITTRSEDTIFPNNNGITKDVQPAVVPVENQNPIFEPDVAPISASMPNSKPSIPYPSSFVDALTLMPKFASTLKALIGNKEKLSEMARTLLNEHCLAVILNKLPEKLGDPDKFLIPLAIPLPDMTVVSNSSPTLTPFGDRQFSTSREADAFLALAVDSNFTES
ncbi:hypothetical protein Tco_0317361 [Tanacetum coccineum]